ncbi:MAG: Csu type fimbrial protein [Lysobacter sp.]
MIRFRSLLPWLLAFACLASAPSAFAQSCTITTADANFGNRSSIDVNTTAQQTSTSNTASCPGGIFSFFNLGSEIRATPMSVNNFQMVGPGGKRINYSGAIVYNGSTYPLVQGQQVGVNFLNIFGIFTGGTGTFAMNYQTVPANLPAGVYTDTINVQWYSHICTAGFIICIAYSDSISYTTIQVTLVVQNDCTMNAPNLSFGTAPVASGFGPAIQTLQIRCTAGSTYTVGLSDGTNYSGGWRRMRQGASANYLRYELYQTVASGSRWGNTPAQRRSSATANTNPTALDGVTFQGYTYRGVIDPTQITPPAGTYVDNIVVDVQF